MTIKVLRADRKEMIHMFLDVTNVAVTSVTDETSVMTITSSEWKGAISISVDLNTQRIVVD